MWVFTRILTRSCCLTYLAQLRLYYSDVSKLHAEITLDLLSGHVSGLAIISLQSIQLILSSGITSRTWQERYYSHTRGRTAYSIRTSISHSSCRKRLYHHQEKAFQVQLWSYGRCRNRSRAYVPSSPICPAWFAGTWYTH